MPRRCCALCKTKQPTLWLLGGCWAAAGRLLEEDKSWSSETCAAHKLQTRVRHAIEGSAPVRHLLATSRKLVGHFNHSALQTERLANEQRKKPPLKVIQDCAMHWNSSFYMLERLLKLKVPLRKVLDGDTATDSDRVLLLKDDQWALAADVVTVLTPFEQATVILSGQEYPTIFLLYPVIAGLQKALLEPIRAAASPAARNFQQ